MPGKDQTKLGSLSGVFCGRQFVTVGLIRLSGSAAENFPPSGEPI
jgi:hypothetical protein